MRSTEKNPETIKALSIDDALRAIQSRGRYCFRVDEIAKIMQRERGSVALKSALARASKAGHIVSIGKQQPWLIVPPEQSAYGAPPIEWWIDNYLSQVEPGYYVALLSAARHWGSSHYANQVMQVMVGKQNPKKTFGRLRLNFSYKKNPERTPVIVAAGSVASFRVSTREATLLDLIRHQDEIGGIEAIARIAHDFSRGITPNGVLAALIALDQAPTAQRLGFIAERVGFSKKILATIENWLCLKRISQQSLQRDGNNHEELLVCDRWSILYTAKQLETIQEIA
jgi:predicted transcriptional regulator of viral defense system